MNDVKLSEFYNDKGNNYHSRTDILKFALIPFMFFVILGFPGKYGGYISTYSNFVAQAFFIMFGFFTLVPDETKRKEKLKKAFIGALILFLIMLVVYVLLNIVYLKYIDSFEFLYSKQLIRKRNLFNFIILNVWPLPIGNSIWFIESLVFAYAFFLISEKIKLSRFYFPILIILSLFMLATGEFAAFFGFPHFGYGYIPAGFITRAIPYMLIGMYLHKNVDKLAKFSAFKYLILFPVGLLMAFAEIELLRRLGKLIYAGHTIGFGLMAVSLCCFALAKPDVKDNFLSRHGRGYSTRMYVLCQPVSFLTWLVAAIINPAYTVYVRVYSCIISLIIAFIISFFISFIKRKIFKRV